MREGGALTLHAPNPVLLQTRPVIQRYAGSSAAQLQTRPRDSERLQATPEPLSFGDTFSSGATCINAQAPTGHIGNG